MYAKIPTGLDLYDEFSAAKAITKDNFICKKFL